MIGRVTLAAAMAGGVAFAATIAATQSPPASDGPFRDITKAAGITFAHHAAPEKKYIVESMSGGVALFDFDNDGLLDIYFVDSLTVDNADDPKQARSALYRNRGGRNQGALQFEDVTDKAGVGHPGWGMGVCTADVDGDGWEDLYVTALGGNKLYRNNHDGTFTDVTAQARVALGGWSAGCGFADYDRDGDLDLFVSRYVKIDLAEPARSSARTRRASTAASPCSAVRAACPASRTSSSATTAAGRSPRSASRRASRTREGTSASASPGSTTTRTAGPTCMSPTTRPRTTST